MQKAYERDHSIIFANRSSLFDECGLAEARSVGISPPTDPEAPWPGTKWNSDGTSNAFTSGVWGQFGVAVTHARAWAAVGSRLGQGWTLVLEDDVLFAHARPPLTWWQALLDILAQVPGSCSFLFVGSCFGQEFKPTDPLLMNQGKWCLHGYALRPRGARLLLNQARRALHTGESEHRDGWLQRQPKLNVRVNVTSGIRMPIDFIPLAYAPHWLGGLTVNLKRAVADGIVLDPFETYPHARWDWGGKQCLKESCRDAGYERFGGIIGQDPSITSTIHGEAYS